MSMRRRLDALEERAMPRRRIPETELAHSDTREYMMEYLSRLAALRRGTLSPEEASEVEAVSAAFEQRLTQIRGEGIR